MSAFLGVETSLTGRCWLGPDDDVLRRAAQLVQQADLSEPLARILAARGIAPAEAAAHLAPTLRALMPDPLRLRDMEKAAARFLAAMQGAERIAIFADYDVDGGASAALILRYLHARGQTATLYIPDRIDEGYGPNTPAMQALGAAHDLIICVDCGTLSHAPIAAAGCDVLVLDHHLGGETLPCAHAVVNPNRQDEDGALGYLCAAGVVFLFLAQTNRLLRDAGADTPDLMGLLDMVALATVADIAPLIGFNRALVRQGLSIMAQRGHIGLAALADMAGLNRAPEAYHLGYLLGPRINAGGRVGAADLGARLLATQDATEAQSLAKRLDVLNAERRAIEAEVLQSAIAQAESRSTGGALVWAAGAGWHPGVVGIVAARLKERFNRPAVVIGLDGGIGKGSGRSVNGVDLGGAIAKLVREGLLEAGGGHKMAAGLTVAEGQLAAAMDRLTALLHAQGAAAPGPRDLHLTATIGAGTATPDLLEDIARAGPFGAAAPAPRFAIAAARISFAKRAGETHLRLTLTDGHAKLDAIAFGAFTTPLGAALQAHGGAPFHFAGRLEIDDWGGRRRAKLQLEDAAPAR
ncbi:single-stranded-DNA-specific exonuclease RecJ [Abyssibius alkaniclasticus]|uniref:single-stranded-DNA-specific exonuclease RecJ n=1 Tax=Abyssibius alkaniclasticus TaxID=2881234 RepID=UPI0040599931